MVFIVVTRLLEVATGAAAARGATAECSLTVSRRAQRLVANRWLDRLHIIVLRVIYYTTNNLIEHNLAVQAVRVPPGHIGAQPPYP